MASSANNPKDKNNTKQDNSDLDWLRESNDTLLKEYAHIIDSSRSKYKAGNHTASINKKIVERRKDYFNSILNSKGEGWAKENAAWVESEKQEINKFSKAAGLNKPYPNLKEQLQQLTEMANELAELKWNQSQGHKVDKEKMMQLSKSFMELREDSVKKGIIKPVLTGKDLTALDKVEDHPKAFARLIDEESKASGKKPLKGAASFTGFLLSTPPQKWDGLLKASHVLDERQKSKGSFKQKMQDFFNKIGNAFNNMAGKGIRSKSIEGVYGLLQKGSVSVLISSAHKDEKTNSGKHSTSFVEKLTSKRQNISGWYR